MKKVRIDQLLLQRGLTSSREKAQRLILAGKVLVDDTPIEKPGQLVPEACQIRLRGEDHPYVSRGGLKLEKALKEFGISVAGKTALDIGASTGGFTHVLLLNDINRVFAIDVGHNQLDWKIRSNPKVTVFEKTNARSMTFDKIGQKVDLIVMDVSFISLEKILPNLLQFAGTETDWITLIKPQFEVGKEKVGKGGIVTSGEDQQEVIQRLKEFGKTIGLIQKGVIDSPITGADGNKEFLAQWKLKK